MSITFNGTGYKEGSITVRRNQPYAAADDVTMTFKFADGVEITLDRRDAFTLRDYLERCLHDAR